MRIQKARLDMLSAAKPFIKRVRVKMIQIPTRKQAPSRTRRRSGCLRPARTAQTPGSRSAAAERTKAQQSPSPSAAEIGTGKRSDAPAAIAIQPKRYKRSRVLKNTPPFTTVWRVKS